MSQLTSEAEVRAWLLSLPGVSRETIARLEHYAAMLAAENARQNLVAASTLGEAFWVRHIADSAQLAALAVDHPGSWIDLGSGAGLPGLVVALLDPDRPVRLVESRRLRCAFLRSVADALELTAQVEVVEARVETLAASGHAVISARAFAPLPRLLQIADHLADLSTIWLLPKGKNAVNELSTVPRAWQKMFHVEPSLTDPDAGILVGRGVPHIR